MFAVATTKPTEITPAVLSIWLLALLERIPGERHRPPDRAPAARHGAIPARHSEKQDVHRLRTTVRRLEVQLSNPPAKVAKSLKALRREAGKVRDIDVHLGLLKSSLLPRLAVRGRISPSAGSSGVRVSPAQQELREILEERRDRHLASLRDLVTEVRPLLEARLPALVELASSGTPSARQAHQQASLACNRFLQWTRTIPEDPARLHRLRINAKKLRYSMEPLQAFDEAAELAGKFKQVQDAIGTWHDWTTLHELAERRLDSADAEPLFAALSARTEREYRKARRVARSVRAWIIGHKPVASAAAAGPPQPERQPLLHTRQAPTQESQPVIPKAG